MQTLIEPYRPEIHGAQVYALWKEVLGDPWPLSRQAFDHTTLDGPGYKAGDHFVAMSHNDVVGFAATQANYPRGAGEIMLIMVRRESQRQKIGTQLLEAATQRLKASGCSKIQLGGGGHSYFWPGIPATLAPAIDFFRQAGWPFQEQCVDLVCNLENYRTPDDVEQRRINAGIALHIANETTAAHVLAFEKEHFPQWAEFCEFRIRTGNRQDLIYATNHAGAIVGSVFTYSPRSNQSEFFQRWLSILGDSTGGLGALGVAENVRGQGIGLALAAFASATLKKRGVRNCYVGWTWLVEWYGKLGYRVWREYQISWMSLA